GTVDWLKERRLAWMDVSRWCQAQPSGELRPQITEDVPKKVAGDDNVELARVAHHLHRQRVNKQVAGVNVCIFAADFLEHALPKAMCERHGIRLVAHAQALQALPSRVLKRATNNALHSLPGVHVFLNSNLVGRVLLEHASNADIQTFRIFAKHNQPDVFLGAVTKRRKPVMQQFDRTG